MRAQPLYVVGGIDIGRVDDTPQHILNLEVDFQDGCRRKYIKAGSDISAFDFLKIGPGLAYKPTSAVAQPVEGVAEINIPAGKFGWVIVHGLAKAKLAAGVVAGDSVGSSAVAGTGAKLNASASPSQAEVQAALAAASGKGVTCVVDQTGGVGTVLLS